MEPQILDLEQPKKMEYAGFALRLVAWLIDILILGAVGFIIGGGSSHHYRITGDRAFDIGYETGRNVPGFILSWLYYALMESSSYQGTLGKMAVGIKVTNMSGERIPFGQATGRYFGKILSAMILLIGFLMVAFTEKKQGLHDVLANTLVVRK